MVENGHWVKAGHWPWFAKHCRAGEIETKICHQYCPTSSCSLFPDFGVYTMKSRQGSQPDGIPLQKFDKSSSFVSRSRTNTKMTESERPSSMRGNHSLFGFSFSHNASPSIIANDGTGISKIDAARVNAPFVMGTSIQQAVPTVCINKDGDRTEKNVRFTFVYPLHPLSSVIFVV